MPERQAMKLPDHGAKAPADDRRRRLAAVIAGSLTGPSGLGTPPSVSKRTLG